MDAATAARTLCVVSFLVLIAAMPPAAAEEPDSDLAEWRSPVAGPTLTEGEYLLLRPVSHRAVDLDGDGRDEQLLIVPFETPNGEVAHSIATLHRTSTGYTSNLLLNVFPDELKSVRLVRFGASPTPKVVVYEQGGSGGFLTLHVYGNRRGGVRPLFHLPGVYQGKYNLLPHGSHATRLVVMRHLAGEINAYPRGFRRESYRWADGRFVLASQRSWRLRPRHSLPARTPATLLGIHPRRLPTHRNSLRASGLR